MNVGRNILRILWLVQIATLLAAIVVLLPTAMFLDYRNEIPADLALLLLVLISTGCSLFLAHRVLTFQRDLIRFVRLMLSGNYESGIPVRLKGHDEVDHLERLLNKMGDQIREYDELRAARVACSYRTLGLLFRTVSDPVLLADMAKRKLAFNPAAQRLFDMEEDNFAFESLEALEENAAFFEMFWEAVERQRIPQEGHVRIQLPSRNTQRQVSVKIFPLKDSEDEVGSALLFLQ